MGVILVQLLLVGVVLGELLVQLAKVHGAETDAADLDAGSTEQVVSLAAELVVEEVDSGVLVQVAVVKLLLVRDLAWIEWQMRQSLLGCRFAAL